MQDKTLDERLFDALLEVSTGEALRLEMESLPSVEELDRMYKPSPDMDKRINDIIKRSNRKRKRANFVRKTGKMVAGIAIVIAIISTLLMSVEATRNVIFNVFFECKEKSTQITFSDKDNDLNELYTPTYIPAGYTEKSTNKYGDTYTIIYKNSEDDIILLDQFPVGDGGISLDNENMKPIETGVSGSTVYLFEATFPDEKSVLLWEKAGVVFQISGSISKDELIKIYESME